jgi:DNA recombination protein RmuC
MRKKKTGNSDVLYDQMSKKMTEQTAYMRTELGNDVRRLESGVKMESVQNREELTASLKRQREEMTTALSIFQTSQENKFFVFETRQAELNKTTEEKLEKIREMTEQKITQLQASNLQKLDEMKTVVDEKLKESVEKRFNESFKGISDRLDDVFKGLGEMQNLANGVGDLKRVLTNVKTRGNLGEIQLGAIMEQILSPEQYEKNVVIKPETAEHVEYAVRLPGRNNHEPVFLAIDSKFPMEDYQRLLDAYENSPKSIETVSKKLENTVKKSAQTIQEKYISSPKTTDFAIMFIPTEGLYAEILRRPGLFESVQREYKIAIVGPTTLVAFLNSLQMGFQTLAVEKRTSEIWELLNAVKTEFEKFEDNLEKTKKKLSEAANVLEKTGAQTRVINKKLKQVQELPLEETSKRLPIPDEEETDMYEI